MERVRARIQGNHGRLTPVPAFEVPIAPDRFDAYFDETESRPGVWPRDARPFVDPQLVADIEQLLEPGNRVDVVSSDSGRGADAYAAAVEIIGLISDVGGAAAAVYGAARLVREAYRRVERRLGRRPLVSVGAARCLAIADLVDRTGSEPFRLVGAGDISDRPPDFSYSGEDLFYVVFERGRELHTYIVESDGVLHYVGSVTRNPNPRDGR